MIRKTIAASGAALLTGLGLFAVSSAVWAQSVPAAGSTDPVEAIVDESGGARPGGEWFAPQPLPAQDPENPAVDDATATATDEDAGAGDEQDLKGEAPSNTEPDAAKDDTAKDDDEAVAKTLTIDVTVDKSEVTHGEEFTFTITVKNVHPEMTIKDVVVRSPELSQCERDHGDMAAGNEITHTCSHVIEKSEQEQTVFQPRFRVRGFDSSGAVVSRHSNETMVTVVTRGDETPSPSGSTSSTPTGPTGPTTPGLPVTGLSTVSTAAIAGAMLVVAGAVLWFLGYRRRARRG